MKKLLFSALLILLTLTACQSQGVDSTKEAAPETGQSSKTDKASSTSEVKITIGEGAESGAMKIITGKKGIVVNEEGILPSELTANVGETLMVYNSLDRQVDLYTTADGSAACPVLEATIEIPGGATSEFLLDQAASCTVINQQNTDQKMLLTVL